MMKKRGGLTLIEVIISLAIVGIIAMVFLSTFTSGIKNIFKTRDSTKDIYLNKEAIDKEIIGEPSELDSTIENKEITIEINGESRPVAGRLITLPKKLDDEDENIDRLQITTFVPDKSQEN